MLVVFLLKESRMQKESVEIKWLKGLPIIVWNAILKIPCELHFLLHSPRSVNHRQPSVSCTSSNYNLYLVPLTLQTKNICWACPFSESRGGRSRLQTRLLGVAHGFSCVVCTLAYTSKVCPVRTKVAATGNLVIKTKKKGKKNWILEFCSSHLINSTIWDIKVFKFAFNLIFVNT